jgi:hypothetical protein
MNLKHDFNIIMDFVDVYARPLAKREREDLDNFFRMD